MKKQTIITDISAMEVFDSRGTPTVEVEVTLSSGCSGRAIAPSGASVGLHEAVELRDGDDRIGGMGVKKACEKVNSDIKNTLIGLDAMDQSVVDVAMIDLDGTRNKAKLGGNAMIATSMAVARAASNSLDIPLYRYLGGAIANIIPVPMMNMINGGMHADNPLKIQEFMIMPVHANSLLEAMTMAAEIFKSLKTILKNKHFNVNVGDEGGFAPQIDNAELALDILMLAIETSGYQPGVDVLVALDVAASCLYNDGFYAVETAELHYEQLISYYRNLIINYPIFSIEDGMSESDEVGFMALSNKLGHAVQLVGDDLFASNVLMLKNGIEKKLCNSILIKPNQIGTISEVMDTIDLARKYSYQVILSHRSGETEDVFISHLAVAVGATQIKTGSLCRSERVAKYNELLRIEKHIGQSATYAGHAVLEMHNNYRAKFSS